MPSSSSGKATRCKERKRVLTQNGPKNKKAGKENCSVLGKRREQAGMQSTKGAESETLGSYSGEKRLALCNINSSVDRVGVASLKWPPTPQ